MKTPFRMSILLVLIGLTGCATTTEVQFTSEPSGATVSLPKNSVLLRRLQELQWVPKGTTPCKVLIPEGTPIARISLGTNQNRIVQLIGRSEQIGAGRRVGTELLLKGAPGFLLAGPVVGPVLAGGAIAAGVDMMQVHSDGQKDFHVDFTWIGGGWMYSDARQYVPLPDQTRLLVNPEQSRVYVMRLESSWDAWNGDTRAQDGAIQMDVWDGDMLIGRVCHSSYLCWERDAGRTTISIKAPTTNTSTVELETQKGHVYYLVQKLRFGWRRTVTELVLVDQSRGRESLNQCGAPTVASP
jgi:hypothetical protein